MIKGWSWLAGAASASSFKTIQTPSGTSPVATGPDDILTFVAGSGITITGNAGTDTITFSSTSMAIGDTVSGGTPGSVLFIGPSGVLAEDNDTFYWDTTAKRLGIGVPIPTYGIDVEVGENAKQARFRSGSGDAAIYVISDPNGVEGQLVADSTSSSVLFGSQSAHDVSVRAQNAEIARFYLGGSVTFNGVIKSTTGLISSIDQNGRNLIDSDGEVSINYDAGILKAASSTLLDWKNTRLKDFSNIDTVNWGQSVLINNGVNAVSWGDYRLNAAGPVEALNWNNRTLTSSTGEEILNWGGELFIVSTATTNVACIVYGRVSQTASLLEFRNTLNPSVALGAFDANAFQFNPLGASGTPSYSFIGDPNTGFYSGGADRINISTAGIDRGEITAAGRWMIGNGSTPIQNIYSATASLNFASIASLATAELTITVTGASTGDAVFLGPPSTLDAGLTVTGYVSATNTVTVRLYNSTLAAIDPAASTWRAAVIKF